MVVMSGDVGLLVCVVWYSSRGVCVECYVVGVFRKSVHHDGRLCMSARVWSVRLHHL